MSNEKDFQQRVQRIGALVQEIECIADPAVRASTTQLVQLIMEFHGTGLDRVMEILADAGDTGITTGPGDADCDFSAVGDEHLAHNGSLLEPWMSLWSTGGSW